jgi:hypothetical protein
MAKKKAAATEFNMSAVVREGLGLHPKASAREIQDYVEAKHPEAKINKGSFSVAFYTTRKKLGIKSGGKPRGRKVGIRVSQSSNHKIDIATLQHAAKFLREAGSAEAALEALKAVQTMQVK